jgi:peptide/nickel transport system ATP-binding protein
MIFQEPMSSLNPVYTCGFQLTEAILQHQNVSQAEARRQAIAGLQEVKLLPSDEELKQTYLEDFPTGEPYSTVARGKGNQPPDQSGKTGNIRSLSS